MTGIRLLRTRPSTVEAVQITEDNRDAVIAWINQTGTAWSYGTRGVTWHATKRGPVEDAFIGDWIVKTAWGEFVSVDDAAIYSRYESINSAVAE